MLVPVPHPSWLPAAVAVGVALLAAVGTSGHAILYKRDDRGTMMWVGLIWVLPVLGPALYLAFGINRIRRRALRLRERRASGGLGKGFCVENEETPTSLAPSLGELASLAAVVTKVTGRPLRKGNEVRPLVNAEQAYPAMLKAIAAAKDTLSLSTYVFDRDEIGREFANHLGAAVRRGVQVRVLIDATGTLLTRHSIVGLLRAYEVPFARFLPALAMGEPFSLNLRSHRKLLVVDGVLGFTGGMNLCSARLRAKRTRVAVDDVHFQVRGPVVGDLQQAFVDDWRFTTGEALGGEVWFPPLTDAGTVLARGVADGPDEEFERTRWIILAAITAARKSLRILTPYFLPDAALISALTLAALRGVSVDIVVPKQSDVPFVQWASMAHWWQLLEHGCRIWITQEGFDHSKIFAVDDAWVLVGSSNWDARSLRLNFEFNLECYATDLAVELAALFEERKRRARPVSLAEMNDRPLAVRLRDGVARLVTPFL